MARIDERLQSASLRAARTWSVLREGTAGYIFLLGIAASVLVAWLASPDLKTAIRYGGTTLQVLGLLLVAYGLDRTRAAFGQPTMTNRVRDWIRRVLTSGRPKHTVISVGSGGITLGGAAVFAHGRAPGATLERRVEVLEEDVEQLRKQSQHSSNALRADLELLKADLTAEVQKRNESDVRVEQLVTELGAGGLHLEWIGLLWLVLATLCTALPEELAHLLS